MPTLQTATYRTNTISGLRLNAFMNDHSVSGRDNARAYRGTTMPTAGTIESAWKTWEYFVSTHGAAHLHAKEARLGACRRYWAAQRVLHNAGFKVYAW